MKMSLARLCVVLPAFLQVVSAQTEGWVRVTPSHSPSARGWSSMAFDEARRVIVLFGGSDSQGKQNDTWTYDGVDWSQQSPAHLPEPRYGHTLAFDRVRQRIILYGGNNQNLGDTWEWSGTDWVKIGSGGDNMPYGSMTFDPVRQQMLRFGAYGTGTTNADTHALVANQWQLLTIPTGGPAPRGKLSMVTDTVRNRVVLHGGYGPTATAPSGGRFNDTWAWNGSVWTQLFTPFSGPPISDPSMAFDSSKGWVIMIGGEQTWPSYPPPPHDNLDTYVFDGTNWSLHELAVRPDNLFIGSPMAYDPIRKKTVLFTAGKTWEYTAPGGQISGSYTPFGQGCAGTGGVPALALNGSLPPTIGMTFSVRITNLPTSPFGTPFGVLGLSKSSWSGLSLPLDLGYVSMPGCTLYVGADLVWQLTPAAGAATWGIPIPQTPWLVGRRLYQQAVLLDPGANLLGVTTSNAAELVIGTL